MTEVSTAGIIFRGSTEEHPRKCVELGSALMHDQLGVIFVAGATVDEMRVRSLAGEFKPEHDPGPAATL
jgi:hypothetical protein